MDIQNSKYQVWCSSVVEIPKSIKATDSQKQIYCFESEFFLVASDDLKEARRYCRKQLNYPGITAAWVIRSKDGEVVQPHEKF